MSGILEFLKRILRPRHPGAVEPKKAKESRPAVPVRKKLLPDMRVISLPLEGILERLPPELKELVKKQPPPGTKLKLHLREVVKQLPAGAVRIRFESLRRRLPIGTFASGRVDGKRMIDLPLAEVLHAIDPKILERRTDQEEYPVPVGGIGIFGADVSERHIVEPVPLETKALWMPGVSDAASDGTPAEGKPRPASVRKPAVNRRAGMMPLPLADLLHEWPSNVRVALSGLPRGASYVHVPTEKAKRAFARGRVVFPWSEVRFWFQPAVAGDADVSEDTELCFPLKLIALALLAEERSGTIPQQPAEASKKTEPAPTTPVTQAADEPSNASPLRLKLESPVPPPEPESPSTLEVEAEPPVDFNWTRKPAPVAAHAENQPAAARAPHMTPAAPSTPAPRTTVRVAPPAAPVSAQSQRAARLGYVHQTHAPSTTIRSPGAANVQEKNQDLDADGKPRKVVPFQEVLLRRVKPGKPAR